MTTEVTTIGVDDDLALALQMMLWSSIRHLPVLEDRRLVGLITDHDLLPPRLASQLDDHLRRRVREVMHRPVKTVHPDEDVRVAATLMATAHIHCLPVVRGAALVGILTSSDVLAEYGQPLTATDRGPRVADVMTRTPIAFRGDDRLIDLVVKMVREGVRHVPVVDEERRIVGMVSDRDVRVVLGDPIHALARSEDLDLDELTVAHAMTPRPVTIQEDASLSELAHLLLGEEIGAAPVVGLDRRLVGLASYVDLLRFVFTA